MASVNITQLLSGYNKALPPNSPGITEVKYDFRAPSFTEMNEVQTIFRLVVTEYMEWKDPRLVYTPEDGKK